MPPAAADNTAGGGFDPALEALRRWVAARLDAMPPDGIYWHSRDGKPCPCEECCTGVRTAPREVVLG